MNFLNSISNLVNEATTTIQGLNIRDLKSDFVWQWQRMIQQQKSFMRIWKLLLIVSTQSLIFSEIVKQLSVISQLTKMKIHFYDEEVQGVTQHSTLDQASDILRMDQGRNIIIFLDKIFFQQT